MKCLNDVRVFWLHIGSLPLSWLHLSLSKRVLLVTFSYGLGIAGLWLFFPASHNGGTMFLPIVSACWLFRYRGLIVSMVLNELAFQLSSPFIMQGTLSNQAIVEGGIIGFGTSLGIGFVVCWLRRSVDTVDASRQQVLTAEQAHLLALQQEHQAKLAYEQQSKMNTLKDQFLLNVSHELRTPLTVLGAYLELLEEHFEDLEPARRVQALQETIKGKEELNSLVNRLLDTAQIMSDIPFTKPKPVNVSQLVQEVVIHLAPLYAQQYTFHIYVPEYIVVWADPQFLGQVLNNLFSNIFKYVPRQTEISVEVTQDDPASLVYLNVQDEGPGIPVEELPLLFEKFVRLTRDLASSTGGTGLGLYICKQLVETMGGQIWVESPGHAGIGSRFCMTLPPYLLP